ncbi:MAG: RecQ family ATP-dependent DNA helicase [Flavobacteriales bacterium]|nr:RecQ family ATP-dependent DNA helicase [Flavobacteriales bacterium]
MYKYWGYSSFRPLQNEIISSIYNKKDTIALLPTGGGKSVCYQVPGLAQEGLTIVISPLIALINDQVEGLKKKGIKAMSVTSALNKRQIDIALDNCAYGNYKFLYISPERLQSPLFRERLIKMKVSMVAVDEAHCISQWGYDFRPAYLQIASIREIHPNVPIIALTASATEKVIQDISEKLQLQEPTLYKKSFTRSNLSYVVLKEENKEKKMLDILRKVKGTSIIYVRSRKQAEQLSAFIRQNGISCDFYHAGLNTHKREEKQKAWMNDLLRVIVSTNAFGMGIDKADVRTVIHFDVCENPENYYQEAGRAGRDGKKAYAVQLLNENDKSLAASKIKNQFPDLEFIQSVYHKLGNFFQVAIGAGKEQSYPFRLGDFLSYTGMPSLPVYYALKVLENNNYISLNEVDNTPSKVQLLMDNESIYDYQLRNEKFSSLLEILLRSYTGLFEQMVNINERTLSKRLKISEKELLRQLEFLHSTKVLEYLPKNNFGSLHYITERIPSNSVVIDNEVYNKRKKTASEKWNNMKAYLDNYQICRSKMLVSFFDEHDATNCGICDVCLERKNLDLSTSEFTTIISEIRSEMLTEPIHMDQLISKLGHRKQNALISAVRWLTDQKSITKKEEQLHWTQK